MKKILAFVLVLLWTTYAISQGCHSDILLKNTTIGGIPAIAATGGLVNVCLETDTAVPCTTMSVVLLYSDSALTKPIPNPVSTDNKGNYSWCAASGTYNQQPTGSGVITKTSGPVTIPINQASSQALLDAALPLRVLFSNAGAVLTASTACGVAPRSGTINTITLATNGLAGNATIDLSTETFAQFLAGTAATSMTNGNTISITGARGIQVTTFTGWVTTTITGGNVYCFTMSNPATIQQLSVLVNY